MTNINIDRSFIIGLANDLITLASGCTVKRIDLANKYETIESMTNFDYYLDAYLKTSTFEGFDTFDEDLMVIAGLTSVEIELSKLSKLNIPKEKRDSLVVLQRTRVLEKFEEKNNYYRSLIGIPNIEDFNFLYVTGPIAGVDTTKPVHLMNNDEITILENLDILSELRTKYPLKRYLNFLGIDKINLISARNAKNFEILKTGNISNISIEKRFLYNYEIAKTYILNNYYKPRHSKDLTYYDSYIGFLIMLVTIITTVDESIKIFNYKEYYNELIIKKILQSHNLNIFDDIPLIYRAKVAHNIESLIVSKGTDEVISKILKIFGFDDIIIRKFYIVKEHRKNSLGEFIFSYEADGITPIYNDMYNIYFSQIDIRSTNIDAEIREPENRLGYYDVTSNDIYWGGTESDEDIRQKLLKENFNYIDTDFISINTAYKLSDLSFEVSYFFSTVLSLKSYIDRLKIVEPLLNSVVDLFYIITMLASLVSKKYNFDGNIITNPTQIATIHRFNFERLTDDITNILKKYNYETSEIYTIIKSIVSLTDKGELLNIYLSNKAIYDKLMTIKTKTKDLNEYLAINELIGYLMTSKMVSDVYTKPDGNIATTYLDYLESHNAAISNYINTLKPNEINDAIFSILSALEDYIGGNVFNNQFLKIPMASGENSVKKYMKKVLNVFKAMSINIFSMTTTYDINDDINGIKIIDKYRFDGIKFNHDIPSLIDSIGFNATINKQDNFRFNDEIEIIETN